jgi:hypothetical protein
LRREHFESFDETRRRRRKNRPRLRQGYVEALARRGLAEFLTEARAYALRYAEDFFGGSNEFALSSEALAEG